MRPRLQNKLKRYIISLFFNLLNFKTNWMSHLFSLESVSTSHPNKACNQISDDIVDAYIAKDPNTKAAVEYLLTLSAGSLS